MSRKRETRRGSASVELLLAMPLVLLGITGMVQFFSLHLARQRTYASLPETARSLVEQGARTAEFSPHGEARCRAEGVIAPPATSLSAAEANACRLAGYQPTPGLRRISMEAETTWQGLLATIRVRVPYRETWIERR